MENKSFWELFTTHKIGLVILGIQALMSIVVFFFIARFGALPNKYLGLVAMILFALLLITFLGQLIQKRWHYAMKAISIVWSIVFLLISFNLYKGYQVADDVTGKSHEVEIIDVVVLADNKAAKVQDVLSEEFGVVYGSNKDGIDAMFAMIGPMEGASISKKDSIDYQELVKKLYNKQLQVIVVCEAFLPIIEEQYANFTTETKVLYSYEFRKSINLSKPNHNVGNLVAPNTTIEPEEVKKITERSFNVFLSGIDVYGNVDKVSRCDVNMIATVNPVTKQILLTSIPRDYYVYTTVSGNMRDKLTHAGIYGVECSVGTLEDLFGVDIDYYLKVNFTGFVDIVDALGGVTVYSEYDFSTSYDFVKGANECDGDKALAFVRDRYSFSSGDLQRNRNQQALVKGIIEKLASPATLVNINSILNSVSEFMVTNVQLSEIMELVNMQLSKNSAWTIQTNAITGTGDSQITYSNQKQKSYVMLPDENQVMEAASRIRDLMEGK